MKIFLAALLMVSAAAMARALDLSAIFTGAARALPTASLFAAAPKAPQPSAADPKPGNCEFPVEIKPDEAHYFIEIKKPIVIDIRTPEEYAAGHLEAVNMHLDYYAPGFKDQLAKLDKDAKYLIYCRSGHRSGITLGIMKNMGFTDFHHIEGGINAWIAAGWPVVK